MEWDEFLLAKLRAGEKTVRKAEVTPEAWHQIAGETSVPRQLVLAQVGAQPLCSACGTQTSMREGGKALAVVLNDDSYHEDGSQALFVLCPECNEELREQKRQLNRVLFARSVPTVVYR